MDEAHNTRFSIQSMDRMMYHDLIHGYWSSYMKRDVAWFVERSLTLRKVKTEHKHPHDKLQSLEVPLWKCE